MNVLAAPLGPSKSELMRHITSGDGQCCGRRRCCGKSHVAGRCIDDDVRFDRAAVRIFCVRSVRHDVVAAVERGPIGWGLCYQAVLLTVAQPPKMPFVLLSPEPARLIAPPFVRNWATEALDCVIAPCKLSVFVCVEITWRAASIVIPLLTVWLADELLTMSPVYAIGVVGLQPRVRGCPPKVCAPATASNVIPVTRRLLRLLLDG